MTVAITKKFEKIYDGIDNMIAAANHDYTKFLDNEKMRKEFCEGWAVNEGTKYIRIISKNSVWGFVVNTENDKKFKKGDLLKSAGYNKPARNAARGNVLEGGFKIEWTGPQYLV